MKVLQIIKFTQQSLLYDHSDSGTVHILLTKSTRRADAAWAGLLKGVEYGDAVAIDRMQQKITLERFHREVGHSYILQIKYFIFIHQPSFAHSLIESWV